MFNKQLTWYDHINYICSKASRRLFFLNLMRRAGRCPDDIMDVYKSTVRSVLESELWHPGLTKEMSDDLDHIQR